MEVCNYQTGQVIGVGNPSSQTLTLGLGGQSKLLLWSTEDGRALDLEVRARVVSLRPEPRDGGDIPSASSARVEIWSELSHGAGVLNVPSPAPVGPLSVAGVGFALPARGLCTRVTARDLALHCRFAGWIGAAPATPATELDLKVSVQVVQGMYLPQLYRSDVVTDTRVSWFPAAATMMRVMGVSAPNVLAGVTLQIIGQGSGSTGHPIAQYGNPGVPIPARGVGCRMTDAGTQNGVLYW